MAAFQVSTSQLRAKAGELREMNAQFKTQVGNLETQETALVSKWEGEAKATFDADFKSDKLKMDEFYQLIERYCVALESMAAEYEKAEQQNVATVMSKS